MAGNDRWIQDALDAWLSDEPGTGPKEDEGWRERTGYFQSAWGAGAGATEAAAVPAPPSAPRPGAAPQQAESRDPGRGALAEGYEEERARLRAMISGFTNRLVYVFPSVPAMTIDDIAAAAASIADMERQLLVVGGWAVLHKARGRPELGREVDAALAELAQFRQAYARQRERIEQSEAQRIWQINRDSDAFVREQERKRRELAEETDREIERRRKETREEQERDRDWQHRINLAYLRGEDVYRIEIRREL